MIAKLKELYQRFNMSFIISLCAAIVMAVFSLYSFFKSSLGVYLYFVVFYFGMGAIRVINEIIYFKNHKDGDAASVYNYLFTGICLLLMNTTLNICLVVTISKKPPMNLPFDWLIYGYAFYAFAKLIFGIHNLNVSRRNKAYYAKAIGFTALISAFLTMFNLEVNLIAANGNQDNWAMVIMEYVSIGVVTLLNLFFSLYLTVGGIKNAIKLAAKKKVAQAKDKILQIKEAYHSREIQKAETIDLTERK